MSRRTNLLIAAAAIAAVGATAATAYAQAQPDRRGEPRRVEREVRIERDGDRVVRIERDGDRIVINRDRKDQAEHLKNILQLRPNQEAALTAYLEAMKPKARTQRLDASERPDSTPEKLARMEQRMNERQAAERARIDAVRRFYAQLDERQKKAFDELPLMMGPGVMRGPMRAMRINMPREFREHFDHHMPLPPAPPAPPSPPSL
jgi:hypothetical protein